MIFALDATPLTVATGGVRRYTLSLAEALAETFPEDEYWMISDQPVTAETQNLPPNFHCETFSARRWWSWGLPRALSKMDAAVFHGTDFSVPYLPARPSVMTVHDLSPWLNASWLKASNKSDTATWQPFARRVRQRTPLLLRGGIATMVITPSETVRGAVIDFFGLCRDRVVAIPLAAAERFRPVEPKMPSNPPYFLFVGTLEPRKNIPRLIEAWREVNKNRKGRNTAAVNLLLAGRVREDFSVPEAEPGLRFLGPVPDDQLPALYSGAIACLYPSLYEGFGLPVLEAMQCGGLVITSRDPAILEVTGGNAPHGISAAMHVEATDTQALIEAMEAAIPNERSIDDLSEMRRRAVVRAQDFSWRATALRTREVYDAAIRVFSHS